MYINLHDFHYAELLQDIDLMSSTRDQTEGAIFERMMSDLVLFFGPPASTIHPTSRAIKCTVA